MKSSTINRVPIRTLQYIETLRLASKLTDWPSERIHKVPTMHEVQNTGAYAYRGV